MANRLLLANYRFVIDGAAVIGPEPRIGKGKALIDMRLGSTSKLLPDKGALGRSPYGLVQNRHKRPIASHSECVFAGAKFPDPVAAGPHQITCSHR
jgi:hypothetical protein